MAPTAKLDARLSPADQRAVSRLLTNDVFEVFGQSFLEGGRFSYSQLRETIFHRASQAVAEAEKDKIVQVHHCDLVQSVLLVTRLQASCQQLLLTQVGTFCRLLQLTLSLQWAQ